MLGIYADESRVRMVAQLFGIDYEQVDGTDRNSKVGDMLAEMDAKGQIANLMTAIYGMLAVGSAGVKVPEEVRAELGIYANHSENGLHEMIDPAVNRVLTTLYAMPFKVMVG